MNLSCPAVKINRLWGQITLGSKPMGPRQWIAGHYTVFE